MSQRFRPWPRTLRFTSEGWWFCAMSVGIGLAAMNTGNNLLYLLLGMLLSIILASGVLSEMSLRGVTARRLPPLRLHAGHPFLMGISLSNSKRRLPSFSIEAEDVCEGRLLDKKCYFLKIPAGRTQQTSYRHVLNRRGRYAFNAFRISTKFPFALFRKSRYVEDACEVIVFPELLPLSELPASLRSALGELSGGRKGRRGLFHGIREYRAGDDPRDVHWRSTARRGRLMVREHEEEAMRQVTIYVDNALSEAEQRDEAAVRQLERAISWAASLAAFYLEQGYAVRLRARGPDAGTQPCVGAHTLPTLLTMLALLPTVSPDAPYFGGGAGVAGEEAAPAPGAPGYADSLLIVRPGRSAGQDIKVGKIIEAR